jgi:hypothetical protein
MNKEERRRYQQLWLYRRRWEWLLANGPCVRCGSMKDLEVHHKDRESKLRRSDHWCWNWTEERRNKELAKCEVLCSRCHKLETKRQLGWGKCGARGYQNGCRCEVCTKAHAARCLDWLRRKRAVQSG